MQKQDSAMRGVLLFSIGVALCTCQDATAKYLSHAWPIGLLAWGRYIVHWLLMTVFLGPRWRGRLIATRHPGLQILRGLLLTAVTLLMMTSFKHMPLAESTAIMFVSPMLVVLLARPLLGETIGRLRWAAVLTGFAGVLILTRPGSGLDPVGLACALSAALCYTGYQLLTRWLAATEHPLTLLYYTAGTGALCLSLALPVLGPMPGLTLSGVLPVVALGVLGGGGHYLITKAFRDAPASLLAPLMYSQLLWAALLGFLVFSDLPGPASLAGMGVIALSGVMIAIDGKRA